MKSTVNKNKPAISKLFGAKLIFALVNVNVTWRIRPVDSSVCEVSVSDLQKCFVVSTELEMPPPKGVG